jgi:phosphatidylserine/phosphatidylglycerophosphate/cardiolipin synthase-like enzyme
MTLAQLVAQARDRVLMTTYLVVKVPELVRTALQALDRGVRVRFVLEPHPTTAAGPGGALGTELASRAEVYVWHDARRLRSGGSPGVVHAKCAVADGAALLTTSANLTEFALTINMELGLLVRGGDVPRQVETHFDRLISMGVLTRV